MKNTAIYALSAGVALLTLPVFALASAGSSTEMRSASQVKEVALTFDDGPYGTSTEEVLAILKKENVPGTFFLIGKNVEKYPALAKEIVQDGHMIGNHTYDHPKNLIKMPLRQVDEELSKTESAIASSTGVHATLFRAPYGSLSKSLRAEIKKTGYTIVPWNVDPKDWDYASSSSAAIEQRILSHLNTHMIIIMHDGRDTHIGYPRDNLIGALPTIIEELKKQGYIFVTADKLAR